MKKLTMKQLGKIAGFVEKLIEKRGGLKILEYSVEYLKNRIALTYTIDVKSNPFTALMYKEMELRVDAFSSPEKITLYNFHLTWMHQGGGQNGCEILGPYDFDFDIKCLTPGDYIPVRELSIGDKCILRNFESMSNAVFKETRELGLTFYSTTLLYVFDVFSDVKPEGFEWTSSENYIVLKKEDQS